MMQNPRTTLLYCSESVPHNNRDSRPAFRWLSTAILLLLLLATNAIIAEDRIRPRAIAVSPDGLRIATANRIANSVSVRDSDSDPSREGVTADFPVGAEPLDLLWRSSQQLLVALHRERCLKEFLETSNGWQLARTIPLEGCPVALAAIPSQLQLPTQPQLIVTTQHPDRVLFLDFVSGRVDRVLPTGNLPRFIAINPQQNCFAVTCELPGEVWCYRLSDGVRLSRQEIHGTAFNVGQPAWLDTAHLAVPVTINRDFPLTEANIARGWVVNNRLVRLKLTEGGGPLEQRHLSLDQQGCGRADLTSVQRDPDGNHLWILASGAQELLRIDLTDFVWPAGEAADFAPHSLTDSPARLQAFDLPGRPIDLAFLNSTTAVLANELADAVQWIDLSTAQPVKTLRLDETEHESLLAQGEQLFYNGRRSRDGWLSCHTCHYDGHTSGQMFDTLNDGTFGTKKLTLSLQLVSETEPWTWHGWQPDLTESMEKSMRDTLYGTLQVTRHDANALAAFSETLRPITRLTAAITSTEPALVNGRTLFFGKAGCSACHEPPHYQSDIRAAVSRVDSASIFDVLNPPALKGVSTRRRFLHHGRAHSLADVLEKYHRPENTSGVSLTPAELQDLLTFVGEL